MINIEPKYIVVFDDPDNLDEPSKILNPTPEFILSAMSGKLKPIWVHWLLQDTEKKFYEKHPIGTPFTHDPEMHRLLETTRNLHPLSEEKAMEYLCMKDLPRKCWSQVHNRPMFKIVLKKYLPKSRIFRNAWEMIYE